MLSSFPCFHLNAFCLLNPDYGQRNFNFCKVWTIFPVGLETRVGKGT